MSKPKKINYSKKEYRLKPTSISYAYDRPFSTDCWAKSGNSKIIYKLRMQRIYEEINNHVDNEEMLLDVIKKQQDVIKILERNLFDVQFTLITKGGSND
jgi:hypothetical protein